MKIAIVEDSGEWMEKIKNKVQRIINGKDVEIKTYDSAEEFLKTKEEYQIVFMDIYLRKMGGFEAVEQYKQQFPDCLIMIVTLSKEFYKEGYKVDAFRYIEKDNLEEDLKEGIEHALIKLRRYQTIDIDIPDKGKILLMYGDIIYIETIKRERKVIFHTKNENYITEEKISELEKRLKEDGFYRSEKSYLVNLDWVDEISLYKMKSTKKIPLKNGQDVPLGVKKKKELMERLNDWKFKILNR